MSRMVSNTSRWLGLMIAILILASCGGGSDDFGGETTAPEARLSSLQIDGQEFDFTPSQTSGYQITVGSTQETITFTATGNDAVSGLRYNLVNTQDYTIDPAGIAFSGGEAITVPVAPGDNYLTISVAQADNEVDLNYRLHIRRTSNVANLTRLQLFDRYDRDLQDNDFRVSLTPGFEQDVYEYSGEISFGACAVQVRLFTNDRLSEATLNGEPIDHLETRFVPTQVGSNELVAQVTSEDGSETRTYTVALERAAPTDNQTANNARLTGVQLSDGNIDFNCADTSYATELSFDTEVLEIDATPEHAGATLTVSKRDEDGSFPDGETLDPGTPVQVAVDEGVNEYRILVTSEGGSNTTAYSILVNRLDRNIVQVETAAELQAALLNAEPRDEIRVVSGDYTGVASAENSGHLAAHFYSAQSGTADNPIYLVGQGGSEPPRILGDNTQANTAFLLSGDHWVVRSVSFGGARNGVVLDQASSNEFRSIDVSGVGGQAMVIRNGSRDNIIQLSTFDETGVDSTTENMANAEGIYIGSESGDWTDAPGGNGSYNPANADNIIRGNEFGRNIAGEAIDIREGVTGTQVSFNRFHGGGLTGNSGDGSFIKNLGNNTDITFNNFYLNGDEQLSAAITNTDTAAEWVAETWGNNTRVFGNVLELDGAAVPAVQATGEGVVLVAGNRLAEDGTPLYQGTSIDQSFAMPNYKFLTAATSEPLCLGIAETTLSSGSTADIVQSVACSEQSTQEWMLELENDGFLLVRSSSENNRYMRPVPNFVSSCNSGAATSETFIVPAPKTEGFGLRWKFTYRANNTFMVNKESTSHALTSGGPDGFSAAQPVVACGLNFSDAQRLNLVEAE